MTQLLEMKRLKSGAGAMSLTRVWNESNKRTTMRRLAPYLGLGIGVLLCIPLALVSIMAAGAGHGTYLPARLLFPFTMFSTFLSSSITAPFVAVGLAQFPLYGLLSGIAYQLGRVRACAFVIVAIHLIAVAVNLTIRNENFPNLVGGPINPISRTAKSAFCSPAIPGIFGALPLPTILSIRSHVRQRWLRRL